MEHSLSEVAIFKSVAYSLLAFFAILVTIVVFIYLSRKRLLADRLKTKEIELNFQRNAIKLIINAQEEERIRIARDLHDDISSKLNAVAISFHILKDKNLSDGERISIADTSLEACKKISDTARNIAHNLMPPTLENTGLDLALRELCNRYFSTSNLQIEYNNPEEQDGFNNLTMEQQIHIYRIIQELINNSIKHAKASIIQLNVIKEDNFLQFVYADNGIGISRETARKHAGIGLNNIASRSRIIQAIPTYHYQERGFKFTLTFNIL